MPPFLAFQYSWFFMRAFLSLVGALWTYSKGRRRIVALYACMFVTGNAIWLFEPYVVGKILNSVQNAATVGGSVHSILMYLALLVGLSAGFWLFHGPARVLERGNAFFVRSSFKDHLFSVITNLPLQWHKNHHSGRTINRVSKAANSLYDFSENGYQIIEMLIRPIGAVVALSIIFPGAAVAAIGAMAVACSLVFLFDRVLFPLYDQINEKDHFVASALHDYLTNITTVITLRLEQLTKSELYRRMTHYVPIFRRETKITEVKWFLATIAISLTTAVILGWYAWSTLTTGVVMAGTFFMLYEYLQRIGGAFYTFAWKYGQVVEQYANLKSVQPILNAERSEEHRNCKLPSAWKKIEILGLDFMYKDEEQRTHHLKNVSVTLKRGQKIAFVGESGSGKSTLMTLIRGLHAADSGEILCDGEKLKHGLKDVGSTVTLIPQEPEIFENTIEYNITLDTSHKKERILEDIELARFSSVLKRLPRGLKTNTAEKGVNLSGGEKQRLALARGIFAAERSSIILLDEPTSSVDPGNERAIYEGMFKHFDDRCIVSSVHKLHLLPMFDYTYVFKEGRLVSEGTPSEMLGSGGPLHDLWERERKAMERR